ncbi:MAG: excinuclease ABC subunit UvrC [Spirochaetota bacterium]|nr:excinuclease ABC subunit UvrC [Spirochaetota bacterium]
MKNQYNNIKNKAASLPNETGVYLMKDSKGNIIYIGKASNLRKRVSSYFQITKQDPKVRIIVNNMKDIEFIITDSEIEALILESSLIKKHKPKYNIRLKDDKKYPYIAVTLNEEFPRIILTRKLLNNGSRYLGPYTEVNAAKRLVTLVNNTFQLKTCKKNLPLKKTERPCLNYQIKNCSGICQGSISQEEYRTNIDNAIKFLNGDTESLITDLHRLMKEYSAQFAYEKAAQIRDMIFNINKTAQKQKVYAPIGQDQDYIGISIQRDEAVILLFEFRKGALIGRKISIFENTEYYNPEEVIKTFVIDYYKREKPPKKIITQHKIDDKPVIENYLLKYSRQKVKISTPLTQNDIGIMNMIQKNLDIIIAERRSYQQLKDKKKGLYEIKKILHLKKIPEILECFDISNIQGQHATGSMVRFKNGIPDKNGYKRYRIKGYNSPNDPGMIHEVVGRRLQHLINKDHEIPDLIIVDGGRSQLNRAYEAAKALDLDIMIISIAKQFEEIYTDFQNEPIRLRKDSPALKIIQNIRDEAHRFAIQYHKKLRSKQLKKSELDEISQIGYHKKNLLLNYFKSVEKIRNSSKEELEKIPGIGNKTANEIYNFFHNN